MPDRLWSALLRAHRKLYLRGWRHAQTLPGWTVAVGALRAGGSGKSPIARLLALRAAQAGLNTALLLRGFRAHPGPNGALAFDSASAQAGLDPGDLLRSVGDEALEAARTLPYPLPGRLRVIAGADRARAARHLAFDATRFILDDGWTHHRLRHDALVVVIGPGDAGHRCIPRGPLRLPPSAIPPHALLWYHDAASPTLPARPAGRLDADLYDRAPVRSHLTLTAAAPGQPEAHLSDLGPVLLICATGAPHRVIQAARRAGAQLNAIHQRPNHHPFSPAEARQLFAHAARAGLTPLTTPKDAARLLAAAPHSAPDLHILRPTLHLTDPHLLLPRLLALPHGGRLPVASGGQGEAPPGPLLSLTSR